jgi:SAM-dependent methyltransferase
MQSCKFSTLFEQTSQDDIRRHVLQFQSYLTLQQYEPVYKKTLDHLQINGKALDWGCGNGHFSYFLLHQNIDVTGYSFDAQPPFLANHKGFRFVAGNINGPKTLPFRNQSFDYVFSIGVLEHVKETGGDELESMLEIFRILKPGGVF